MICEPVRRGILISTFCIAACASMPAAKLESGALVLDWTQPEKRVVFLGAAFDLRENPVSGDPSRREDWNEKARTFAAKQIGLALAAKHIALVVPSDPTSSNDFDALRTRYGADYAFSLNAQNTYDSPGNAAANAAVVVGLAGLVVIAPGIIGFWGLCELRYDFDCHGGHDTAQRTARVSLLDLRTGVTTWSKSLDGGDWRNEASTKQAITNLLKDSPF